MLNEVFIQDINKEHKYGLGTKVEEGVVNLIQTYETIEELREGYKRLLKSARSKPILTPLPFEFTDENSGRILTNILKEFDVLQ